MDWKELNKELSKYPAWQKVRRFYDLQEIFLCISLMCAIFKIAFDTRDLFWSVAFLITGILSVVFGYMSQKTLQKHFVRKSDIANGDLICESSGPALGGERDERNL